MYGAQLAISNGEAPIFIEPMEHYDHGRALFFRIRAIFYMFLPLYRNNLLVVIYHTSSRLMFSLIVIELIGPFVFFVKKLAEIL